MNARTRTALEILAVAAGLGIFGNLMLRQTPWGINAFLFVTAFVAGMFFLTRRHRPQLVTFRTMALQAAMVFFASMFLIRDSIELRVYDTFAIIILMGVLLLSNYGVNQRIAGVLHYAAGTVWAGICSLFSPFLLLGSDIDWKTMPGSRLSRNIFAVLRGLAIALPLLLIFGALFAAADAAFENFTGRIVNFNLDTVISHVLLTSFLMWLTAGYFRSSIVENIAAAVSLRVTPEPAADKAEEEAKETGPLPDYATILEHINRSDPPNADDAKTASSSDPASDENTKKPWDWQNIDNSRLPGVFTLGTVETVIVLGLLNVLFLAFVVFQLPYFFGGMELVQTTPGLTLADFARRGFGELVAVAFLVLPLLLVTHWLQRRDSGKNETVYRVLAGTQIVLLFVIMASAMQRLFLLTGELGYGWTTVRFYPMVFMVWLACVFVWFGWTVLRGSRQNFAWGALWSAIVILGVTNLMNPDDFIARKNIQLMQQGREYDAWYHTYELSDDAIPALIDGLPAMSAEDACFTKQNLHRRLTEARGESDIRSLNWSREAAYRLLESNSGILLNQSGCDPDAVKWH